MKENHCLPGIFAVLCHCPKGTDVVFRGHRGCGVPETAHNKSLNYKSELWKQSTGLNYRELWAT